MGGSALPPAIDVFNESLVGNLSLASFNVWAIYLVCYDITPLSRCSCIMKFENLNEKITY